MKKYSILLFTAFISLSVFAQKTIPNPSFESWQNDSVKVITEIHYLNPTGWTTPNSLTLSFGGTTEVTQSTNSYGGTYAAQLETQEVPIVNINIPGVVLFGTVDIAGKKITGGVPFTARPDTFYGYYEYTPASGQTDSCFAFLFLTHWNAQKDSTDTVAVGIFKSSGNTVSSYTKFSLYINYLTGETPDTLQLAISSSSQFLNSPPVGSIMLVDSLTFSTDTSAASGINTLTDKGFGVSCYPNPANTNLNILISEPRAGMIIKVYDALGRDMLSVNNEGLITSIDVSKLPNGLYFYEVVDNSGNSLKTDKFNVAR